MRTSEKSRKNLGIVMWLSLAISLLRGGGLYQVIYDTYYSPFRTLVIPSDVSDPKLLRSMNNLSALNQITALVKGPPFAILFCLGTLIAVYFVLLPEARRTGIFGLLVSLLICIYGFVALQIYPSTLRAHW
jgi:hypothetical protein